MSNTHTHKVIALLFFYLSEFPLQIHQWFFNVCVPGEDRRDPCLALTMIEWSSKYEHTPHAKSRGQTRVAATSILVLVLRNLSCLPAALDCVREGVRRSWLCNVPSTSPCPVSSQTARNQGDRCWDLEHSCFSTLPSHTWLFVIVNTWNQMPSVPFPGMLCFHHPGSPASIWTRTPSAQGLCSVSARVSSWWWQSVY